MRVNYRNQVAEFAVEDTGIGIHQSDLERIFQPFERARTARAKATTGTGLGLTITKLLTNIMGGEITVNSTVGKGSMLPRQAAAVRGVAPAHRLHARKIASRGYVGPRQTILVVDDDEIQRDLVRDLLSRSASTC